MFGFGVLFGFVISLLDIAIKVLLIYTLLKMLKALDIYIKRNV